MFSYPISLFSASLGTMTVGFVLNFTFSTYKLDLQPEADLL